MPPATRLCVCFVVMAESKQQFLDALYQQSPDKQHLNDVFTVLMRPQPKVCEDNTWLSWLVSYLVSYLVS